MKLLADRGIDYFFANAGTDFTPIIEAFAKAQALNIPAPTPIAKLAARDKLVIATEGDGAYMFGNPVSAHYVAAAHDLPFLTVIFNNERWDAVGRATRAMYPDGYAVNSNQEPLTLLQPSPKLEQVVTASDGYGERVEDPAELHAALERGLKAVTVDKRQAVLNVICQSS